MAVLAKHVVVSGLVQGVGFRWHARRQATALGLAGWVRNLVDGRVEAWVEGDPESVAAMLAWLEVGPRSAHVTDLCVDDEDPSRQVGFDVRH